MRVPTARSAPSSVAPDRPRAATTICSRDAVTAFVERNAGQPRTAHGPRCWAAWAKMSRTSLGDRILITRRWATPRNTGSGPDTTLTPPWFRSPAPKTPKPAHISKTAAPSAPPPPSLPRQRPAQASAVTAQVRRVADVAETIAPGMPRGLLSGRTVPRHTVRRPPNRQRDNALRGDAHPCQNSCAIAIMARAAAPGVRSDGAARENCHSRSASSTVSVATSSCPLGRATRGSSATPRPFRT